MTQTLIASCKEMLAFVIAERDAFMEFSTDFEGFVEVEYLAELGRIDGIIDRAQAALAGATKSVGIGSGIRIEVEGVGTCFCPVEDGIARMYRNTIEDIARLWAANNLNSTQERG